MILTYSLFCLYIIQESGAGEGGYAKDISEMSQEFQDAQKALYAKQCEECDVVITTALVPGKPAPKLVSKVRFEVMIDACLRANLMNFQFLIYQQKLVDQILNFVDTDKDLYFCESTIL